MRHQDGRPKGEAVDPSDRHHCNHMRRDGFQAGRAMVVMSGMGRFVGFGWRFIVEAISAMKIGIDHFERVGVDLALTMGNRRRADAAE